MAVRITPSLAAIPYSARSAFPDSLAGEKAERFDVHLTMNNGWYSYNANDKVVVNGSKSFPMPKPTELSPISRFLVSAINAYTEIINLLVGTLLNRRKYFRFYLPEFRGVTNVHIRKLISQRVQPRLHTSTHPGYRFNAVPNLARCWSSRLPPHSFNGTQLRYCRYSNFEDPMSTGPTSMAGCHRRNW